MRHDVDDHGDVASWYWCPVTVNHIAVNDDGAGDDYEILSTMAMLLAGNEILSTMAMLLAGNEILSTMAMLLAEVNQYDRMH
jgi:hypothetical protein